MAFVQFTKVSLAFGDRDILKNAGLNLAQGSRAGLTGANGSGKSTLMKVIAGLLAPDSGDRAVQKGTRVSYLPQSGIVHRGRTLRAEAETAYQNITAMLDRMEEIGRVLEKSGQDGPNIRTLLEEHQKLQEDVENSGYYQRESSIYSCLLGLGFSSADLDRQAEEFSGGWQMRIALAKLLLQRPDILLLDEPTNYLDIEARSWLEQWLKSFTGGYLLVSHDRYFLDVSINEVYELFQGNLKRYAGNFSEYERVREVELESLMVRYKAQQEEIAKTEALIRRFRYKASKAAFAQELIKRLDKIERIEIPESFKKISINFPPPPHSGRVVVSLSQIGKSYGQRQVLSGLDLGLERGERLVVAGKNGAGKTTLLRIIAGVDPSFEGELQYGSGVAAGYFSQDAAETMTSPVQVLEFLEADAPTALIPRVRDTLGAFLFRGDDVHKPVSVLSGGEKSRLALLRMLLKPMNLLILDEPTNHLDMYSKDILLSTLKKYTGTIIFVSHDRDFMEALSTKTLELSAPDSGGSPVHRLFYGNYGYYLDRLERENQEGGSPPPVSSRKTCGGPEVRSKSSAPLSSPEETDTAASDGPAQETPGAYGGTLPKTILVKVGSSKDFSSPAEKRAAAKEKQALIRRLERREGEILRELEKLEAEKNHLEADLARSEVYTSGEKAKAVKAALDTTFRAIETKNAEWEALAAELAEARKE